MESFNIADFLEAVEQGYRMPITGTNLNRALVRFEQALICKALKISKGNVTAAGEILDLNRTTLHEKMVKFGISRADCV